MGQNKWIEGLKWKSPAKQGRAHRTIDALLDAAERLFAVRGLEATSVTDIARDSGCSIGALYHHFKDKAALQEALYARSVERIIASGKEALEPARWQGATILDIIRGFLEFSLQAERESPGFKIALMQAIKSDPALQDHFNEVEIRLFSGLRALLDARRDTIGHPDPDLAISYVIDLSMSMVHLRYDKMVKFKQLGDAPDEVFVDEVLRSVAAYLQLKA